MTDEELEVMMTALFAASSDGIAFIAPDFTVRTANETFAQYMGVPLAQISGGSGERITVGDLSREKAVYEKVRRTGEPFKSEAYPYYWESPDGLKITYWKASMGPVYGKNGAFWGWLLILRDVTEAKEIETERASFFEQSPAGIALLDGRTLTVKRINPVFMKFVGPGVAGDAAMGSAIEDLLPPAGKVKLMPIIRDVVVTGKPAQEIYEKPSEDGEISYWNFNVIPVSNLSAILDLMVTTYDITPQILYRMKLKEYALQAEEHLRQMEAVTRCLEQEQARLQAVLDQMPSGVIMIEASSGKLVKLNRQARKILGLADGPLEELAWENICKFSHDAEQPYRTDEIPLARAFYHGENVANAEMGFTKSNGSKGCVLASAAPVLGRNGAIVAGIMVFTDITGYRNAMRKASQKEREAETARIQKLESLGVLAGGIAHDFNNYLAAVMSNIQLAGMRLSHGGEIQPLLKTVEDVLVQASSLTQQLLAFSKGGAPVKKIVSVKDLVLDTVKFGLRGSKVSYCKEIPADLWMAEIDAAQITQVLTNLMINATQAMLDGGLITVRCENVSIEPGEPLPLQPGKYIKVSVADQGLGISRENLGKVFDPYFTTKKMGNGLGLTVCYRIIRNHDGYIGVECSEGSGTTFYFYLPAIPEATDPSGAGDDNHFTGKAERGRILIMDDEQNIAVPLSQILHEVGYETDIAADGGEAIIKYARAQEAGKPYDVVVLDLTVPGGMGGAETMERLLRIDPNVKAVVSSGYSNSLVLSNPAQFHFRAVVTKPYRIGELRRVLAQLLNSQ